MGFDRFRFVRIAVLAVALAFLVYNIYQATVTTLIVSHFPLLIERLPNVIQSSNPSLQLALFLAQEVAGSIGQYMRLIGAMFGLGSAVLFYRKKSGYLNKLRTALLFEALYFLLYIPVVINHLVGSTISTSSYLNFNVGISYLLQIALIFPSLFIMSLKLRDSSNADAAFSWAIVAAPIYLFGLWVRHGFLWVYGVLPMETQLTPIDLAGAANSLLTLLLAAIICSVACFMVKTNSGQAKTIWVMSITVVLTGAFFVLYDVISVFSPIYGAYVLLTDAWMITLLPLGIALLMEFKSETQPSISKLLS